MIKCSSRGHWRAGRSVVMNHDGDGEMAQKLSTVKVGEHTYASWGTETDNRGPNCGADENDFFLEDDEGDVDDQGQVDMTEYIRDTAARAYDSIFFYGLDIGSKARSQRTPRSNRRSPFFTNSELIGEELMDSPKVDLDVLRKERPISVTPASAQRRMTTRTGTDNGGTEVVARLHFLEEEIAFIREELEVLEVTIEVGDVPGSLERKMRMLNDLDTLNIEYVNLAAGCEPSS